MSILLEIFDQLRFALGLLAVTWVFCFGVFPRRQKFPRNAVLSALVCAALALGQTLFQHLLLSSALDIRLDLFLLGLWGILVSAAVVIGTHSCFQISWTNTLSRALLGVCFERTYSAVFSSWIFNVWFEQFPEDHFILYMLIILASYILLLALCRRFLLRQFRRELLPGNTESRILCVLYLSSYLLLHIISSLASVICEWSLRDVWEVESLVGRGLFIFYFCSAMQIVIALILFIFQYGIYNVFCLRQETALLGQLLSERAKQYSQSAENIDIINHKCHDLKHQISALEYADDARRGDLFREVEEAVMLYDSSVRTGNEALDTLLTEKSLYCAKHSIRLSCTVSGHNLDKIDVVDLYTLLGNAIDNAVEYVETLEDTDKRVISLSTEQKGNLLIITIDNYFEGQLVLQDGLPVTRKEDKSSHGLGLKSIRMIAGKYGGDIRISTSSLTFTLQISMIAA